MPAFAIRSNDLTRQTVASTMLDAEKTKLMVKDTAEHTSAIPHDLPKKARLFHISTDDTYKILSDIPRPRKTGVATAMQRV